MCYPSVTPRILWLAKVLTQIGIDRLKPSNQRQEIPDAGLSGLYLVVQPTGIKSFAVRYRHDGRPRKLTIGRYPQLSIQEARIRAREALERLSYGDDPGRQKDNPERFEAAFSIFMKRHVSQTKGTYETNRIYKHDLLPKFKGKYLSQVARRDVIALLDDIVDRGSPIMANRVLAVLRKFFSWAVARDLTKSNPCEGVTPPSKQTSRDRILNDVEIRVFWQACNELKYPYGTYFKFLLLSAQRRTEVSEMTFEELDGDEWVIPPQRAKNGQRHRVPITTEMRALLQSTGRNSGYVFTVSGNHPINNLGRAATRLRKKMSEIAEVSGLSLLDEWKPHDLRRTAASGMAKCGVFQEVIERVQNRISGKFAGVAGIYNRYDYEKEKKEALEKWSKALDF
jgi:integrase